MPEPPRPLRRASAERELKTTTNENRTVTNTPAKSEDQTTWSSSPPSTDAIAIRLALRRQGLAGDDAAPERDAEGDEQRRADHDRAGRAVAEHAHDAVGERADRPGRRQREHPRDDDVARHAPAHGREALGGARAHDRAGDDLRRRQREARMGGREDH